MIENLYGLAQRPEPDDPATGLSRVRAVKKRIKGYVILDSTWARRLGIRRSGGMYRITRRELMQRLTQLQQAPMERVLIPAAAQDGVDQTTTGPPLDDIVALGQHFVGFYETEAFLVDSVRDFLASGLRTGDAAIVVATDAHRASLDRALMEAGIELPEAHRCGRFIALGASEMLAKFMVDGMPDAARFSAAIGQLVSRAAESGRGVRIYGEMVAVLWQEGHGAAAIALEDLWNDLAARYPFSLFCAYPMRAFDTDTSADGFWRICGQHSRALLEDQGA